MCSYAVHVLRLSSRNSGLAAIDRDPLAEGAEVGRSRRHRTTARDSILSRSGRVGEIWTGVVSDIFFSASTERISRDAKLGAKSQQPGRWLR